MSVRFPQISTFRGKFTGATPKIGTWQGALQALVPDSMITVNALKAQKPKATPPPAPSVSPSASPLTQGAQAMQQAPAPSGPSL